MSQAEMGTKEFKPQIVLTRWLFCLLLALIVATITALSFEIAEVSILRNIVAGIVIAEADIEAASMATYLASLTQYILLGVSFVIFLIWLYRAYSNAQSLHIEGLRYSPGWAVGWFFIPIMHYFRPYQVVSLIYKASKAKVEDTNVLSWQKSKTPFEVKVWWTLYLVTAHLAVVTTALFYNTEDLSNLIRVTYISIVYDSLIIVGTVMLVLIIRRIRKFQELKHKVIGIST